MNRQLSIPLTPADKDALWACAGMLGLLAFATFESTTPDDSWPLADSPLDLEWLKLCEGKKQIWKIADPMREDSLFHTIVPNFLGEPPSCYNPSLQRLPDELLDLCNLKDPKGSETNPYLSPACFLAEVVDITCNNENLASFISFFGRIKADYKQLLSVKDPAALLLLANWYAKMCQYRQWWIWPRTVLECQAICRYLRLYHGENERIIKSLSFPEVVSAKQLQMGMPRRS